MLTTTVKALGQSDLGGDGPCFDSPDATIRAEGINQKIAALAGTTAEQIVIEDLEVNPISRQAYLAVSRGRGRMRCQCSCGSKATDSLSW